MTSNQQSRVEWRSVAEDLKADGALRDIYVHDATLADWQVALDRVRVLYAPLEFRVDGHQADLPAQVAEIFPIRERASPSLSFDLSGIDVACHFFTQEEIEFDLRPEEVTGPERLAAVVSFLRELATAVGKPAVLTMESVPGAVILRADPVSGTVVWVPPPDATTG
jgi:hypothetical protein